MVDIGEDHRFEQRAVRRLLAAMARKGSAGDSMSITADVQLESPPGAPRGLLYLPDFLSVSEEKALLKGLKRLNWAKHGVVQFRGRVAVRRQIDYLYNFNYYTRTLSPGRALPKFLEALRERCEDVLELERDALKSVIALEYRPGARIGWHIDATSFGDTILGVSLGSRCPMRFRHKVKKKVWSLDLDPRSLVVMTGPVRYDYEHEIPRVKEDRYCITMRNMPDGFVEVE
jgi:alkylated DNA repair dioxygenase AlkB